MLLDYNKIDPELLPAIEQLPNLEITRENVQQVRDIGEQAAAAVCRRGDGDR